MPKIAVNEYREPDASNDKIGGAPENRYLGDNCEATSPQRGFQCKLTFCTAPADGAHTCRH
ncbi:hypothetical protein ACVW1C_000468 [Bradyrhizobium sp. USDA 4011]